MNYVMNKNGTRMLNKVYDDRSKYIADYILSRFIRGIDYKPILSVMHLETKSEYEDIFNIFKNTKFTEDSLLTAWELLKPIITDDTYYILYVFEDFTGNLIISNEEYGDSGGDDGGEQEVEFNRTALNLSKVESSVLKLTKDFKHSPIQAFVRFRHFRGRSKRYMWGMHSGQDTKDVEDSKTPENICADVLDTYWIYAFLYGRGEYIKFVSFDKVNMNILASVDNKEIFGTTLLHIDEYYKKTIEQLKEQHQKEIEELLAPGGGAYLLAKERFESNQKELDDELN